SRCVHSSVAVHVSVRTLWLRCSRVCCLVSRWCRLFFFFQAEDGIRDATVTGVQTCALPISRSFSPISSRKSEPSWASSNCPSLRSEERRVGKECGSRRSAYHEKKKTGYKRARHPLGKRNAGRPVRVRTNSVARGRRT